MYEANMKHWCEEHVGSSMNLKVTENIHIKREREPLNFKSSADKFW